MAEKKDTQSSSGGTTPPGGSYFAPTTRQASLLLTPTSITFLPGSMGPPERPSDVITIHPSLELILREIEDAFRSGRWYVALATTLSLPDICACLESDPDKIWSTEAKYVAWFNANVGKAFDNLTGLDCYRLRGGVLHNGKLGHAKLPYDRVVFTLPTGSIDFGESIMEIDDKKILTLSLERFCAAIVGGVRGWAEKNGSNPNVNSNYANLVCFRPDGLKPYFDGIMVVA